MRQAGRILEPYRVLKGKTGSIQKLFDDPELVTQITLMPVDMLEVDAAILFADIFTPVMPLGCDIVFDPGPTIGSPLRTREDVDGMRSYDPEQELSHVHQAIGEINRALPAAVPLIGFAGAPFTLATYLVEGGSAKEYSRFRQMLHIDAGCAHALMSRLTDLTIAYLQMAGAGRSEGCSAVRYLRRRSVGERIHHHMPSLPRPHFCGSGIIRSAADIFRARSDTPSR